MRWKQFFVDPRLFENTFSMNLEKQSCSISENDLLHYSLKSHRRDINSMFNMFNNVILSQTQEMEERIFNHLKSETERSREAKEPGNKGDELYLGKPVEVWQITCHLNSPLSLTIFPQHLSHTIFSQYLSIAICSQYLCIAIFYNICSTQFVHPKWTFQWITQVVLSFYKAPSGALFSVFWPDLRCILVTNEQETNRRGPSNTNIIHKCVHFTFNVFRNILVTRGRLSSTNLCPSHSPTLICPTHIYALKLTILTPLRTPPTSSNNFFFWQTYSLLIFFRTHV